MSTFDLEAKPNESRALENVASRTRIAIRPHLDLRPVRARDAVRIFIAYLAAVPLRLFARRQFEYMGFLIPGKSPMTVTVAGIIAKARPYTNDLTILVGNQEPKTASLLKVSRGDVVIDVGAHIGSYTLSTAKLASKVIAIEPDPSNYFMLQENVKLNQFSNVVALQIALSSSPGNRTLYASYGANTGTPSLEIGWTGNILKPVEVRCETLDRLVASLDLQRIDWLKIDVEGHEISVLEGASSTLRRTKHMVLEVARGHEEACRRLIKDT